MAVLQHRYGDTAEGETVRIPAGSTDFPLSQNVKTASGAHSAYYSMRIDVFFPAIKRLGRERNHLSASSAEVKNEWSYTSTPYTFMALTGTPLLCISFRTFR
jgi:hypothetical protein